MKNHVESKERFNFIIDFKDILEQLSYVTSLKELSQLTQTFFERAFEVPLGRVRLYIRQEEAPQDNKNNLYHDIVHTQDKVEKFLAHMNYQAILLQVYINGRYLLKMRLSLLIFMKRQNKEMR